MKNNHILICILVGLLAACSQNPKRENKLASPQQRTEKSCDAVNLPMSSIFSASEFESNLPKQGQWRDGFDLADMNADGFLDVVFGPARKGNFRPNIFLGDGQGQFKLWASAHYPPLPYDYGDIKVADLNQDGVKDMVLGSHLRGIVALIQETNGSFAPWGEGMSYRAPGEFPGELSFSSRALALVDWNLDYKIDVLAMNEGPSRFATGARNTEALALFLNRDGYWDRRPSTHMLSSFGTAIAIGKINNDLWPDAVIGTDRSGVKLLLLIGNGNSYTPAEIKSLPFDAAVTAVEVFDLNKNGLDDIFLATRYIGGKEFCISAQTLEKQLDGSEISKTLWRARGRDAIAKMRVKDLNQDGFAELLVLRELGGLTIFAGNKNGFTHDLQITAPAWLESCQAFDFKVSNIDTDPSNELIISYAGDHSGTDAAPCGTGGGFYTLQINGTSPTP